VVATFRAGVGRAAPDRDRRVYSGANGRDRGDERHAGRPLGALFGIWRGQVWIAEDFDELPDDLAEPFGIAK
jgi:hypothetical protein